MIFEILGWFSVLCVGTVAVFVGIREAYYIIRYRGGFTDKLETTIIVIVLLVGCLFLWNVFTHIPFEITFKSHL